MEIVINPRIKWVAKDMGGFLYGYENKPTLGEYAWLREDGKSQGVSSIIANDLGPWRESLHQIIDNKLVKYVDIPAKDEPVLVWNEEGDHCQRRRYSTGEVNSVGELQCYDYGRTSWSDDGDTNSGNWKYWRRPTPAELEDRA